MAQPGVTCGCCQESLPPEVWNRDELASCPACGAQVWARVFPASLRPITGGRAGESVTQDGEANCYYHPQKKAEIPCHRCGRFLCALCDVELNGEHLCPACLQTGAQKGKLQAIENRRVLYDDIACALAVWPMLPFLWFFIPLTAPVALYLAIRHWKTPTSVVPRSHARFIVAIVLSGLQLLALVIGVAALFITRGAG